MALRVLLADESSTIKKVMQLALQDFGVEVKSVPIGLDVLQVARSFQPDVIFADVLLSKRNGYEVAAEIKGDSALKKIPVILMWSGFMEIDEAKARSSGAEKRLEKPFDADQLRSLVKEVVPRLSENKLSDYLSFPDLPEIVETPAEPPPFQPSARGGGGSTQPQAKAPMEAPVGFEGLEVASFDSIETDESDVFEAPVGILSAEPPPKPKAAPAKAPLQAPVAPKAKPSAPPASPSPQFSAPPAPKAKPSKKEPAAFSFESEDRDLEDPDDFQQVPLPGAKTKNAFEQQKDSEDWRTGALEQFRVAPEGSSVDSFENPDGFMEVSDASIAMTGGVEDISIEDLEDLTQAHQKPTAPPPRLRPQASANPPPAETFNVASSLSTSGIDPMRAEEILREQMREVLENIAWKIIPDIAERVVREEVQRLLKEAERLS